MTESELFNNPAPVDDKADAELVALALRDRRLFAAIVLKYEAPLRRYISRLGCKDPEDREDVLQETFLKVYINLNEYDAGLKFSSWLYRITHNETVSFFRKKNVRPEPLVTEEDLRQFQNIAGATDVEGSFAKEWDAGLVRQALMKVKSQYRDVLVLKFIEEKSYNEISDILKIPIGTVGTLVNRGKKQLKLVLLNKNL